MTLMIWRGHDLHEDRGRRDILVYIPTKPLIQRAFLFALKDTIVTIDGVTFKLDADDIFSIPPGLHRITPSSNVLIQIIYWSGMSHFKDCHSSQR